MLDAFTPVFRALVGWLGTLVRSIFKSSGSMYALLPAIGIAVGVAVVTVSVKVIKDIINGY